MADVQGPLTPYHISDKVLVTCNQNKCEMLARDSNAVQVEPENELADVSLSLYGDSETVITRSDLATVTKSFKGTSPTLRDVKPVLAELTLAEGGYPEEVLDQNESSKMQLAANKAVLMHGIDKSRGAPTLNTESIVSKGLFMKGQSKTTAGN